MAKKIRCTNCQYEGPPETKAKGVAWTVLGLLAIAVGGYSAWSWVSAPSAARSLEPGWETSVLMWLGLAVVGFVVMIFGVLSGEDWICPKCKWKHPVRL
jgi:hypothetical protein